MGPGAILRGIGAALRGNFVGIPKGDPMIMPGAFVVAGRKVVFEHRATNAGDHPDFAAMAAAHERSRAAASEPASGSD